MAHVFTVPGYRTRHHQRAKEEENAINQITIFLLLFRTPECVYLVNYVFEGIDCIALF